MFKAGDKVKLINNDFFPQLVLGTRGTVVYVYIDRHWRGVKKKFNVKFHGCLYIKSCYFNEIELLSEEE